MCSLLERCENARGQKKHPSGARQARLRAGPGPAPAEGSEPASGAPVSETEPAMTIDHVRQAGEYHKAANHSFGGALPGGAYSVEPGWRWLRVGLKQPGSSAPAEISIEGQFESSTPQFPDFWQFPASDLFLNRRESRLPPIEIGKNEITFVRCTQFANSLHEFLISQVV